MKTEYYYAIIGLLIGVSITLLAQTALKIERNVGRHEVISECLEFGRTKSLIYGYECSMEKAE